MRLPAKPFKGSLITSNPLPTAAAARPNPAPIDAIKPARPTPIRGNTNAKMAAAFSNPGLPRAMTNPAKAPPASPPKNLPIMPPILPPPEPPPPAAPPPAAPPPVAPAPTILAVGAAEPPDARSLALNSF